jgi:hypothetical protein
MTKHFTTCLTHCEKTCVSKMTTHSELSFSSDHLEAFECLWSTQKVVLLLWIKIRSPNYFFSQLFLFKAFIRHESKWIYVSQIVKWNKSKNYVNYFRISSWKAFSLEIVWNVTNLVKQDFDRARRGRSEDLKSKGNCGAKLLPRAS